MIKFLFLFISLNALAQLQNLPIPNFEYLQKYLDAAPVGVDARYAWTLPGGTGKNVKIIDIEQGLTPYNELPEPFVFNTKLESEHGSAVMGTLVSKNDGVGTTGIVYDAKWGFFSNYFFGAKYQMYDPPEMIRSIFAASIAKTIRAATKELEAGDILVLEVQVAGVGNRFAPLEFWPEAREALTEATQKGIHCVAAAGNGGHSLDDKRYENLFKSKKNDSGCIIVAAVTLEPTSDKRGHRKVNSSNYGSRIDTHGYGKNVASVGYGNLFDDGKNKYTRFFAGTSSATGIVAGAVAAVSSIAKEQGKLLSPRKLRKALRKTGTKAYGENKFKIGTLPDIKELVDYLNLN